jgi:hypothetical protein
MNILSVIAASRRRGDPDAADYFARIVSAGSTISANNQSAVNAFIVGCKADGIWTAIKAACFLAGPDDLTGALVPLVGTAPTNNGPFVSADYNRTTGLSNQGSVKYLNTNRNNNADPQNDKHCGVYTTDFPSTGGTFKELISSGNSATGHTLINRNGADTVFTALCNYSQSATPVAASRASGFYGVSRSNSSNFVFKYPGSSTSLSDNSSEPANASILVFTRTPSFTGLFNGRISFYSIGESLDLAALDARLATYMSSIT